MLCTTQFFASERLPDICTLSMICDIVSEKITYLLWHCIQLGGIAKEAASGTEKFLRRLR